jgi:hypothetical protein
MLQTNVNTFLKTIGVDLQDCMASEDGSDTIFQYSDNHL